MQKLVLSICIYCLLLFMAQIALAEANLRPFQPQGWSDALVVSTVEDSSIDCSSPTTADPLFVRWSAVNDGPDKIDRSFTVALYLDGIMVGSWRVDTATPAGPFQVTGFCLRPLSEGLHKIALYIDPTNEIKNETTKSDNSRERTINVHSADSAVGQAAKFTFASILGYIVVECFKALIGG